MRRCVIFAVVCLLTGGAAFAADVLTRDGRDARVALEGDIEGFPGLRIASTADVAFAKSTIVAPETGTRPAVLLETDYYIYPYVDESDNTIETPTVYLTLDANGYPMPVTMYFYWEERTDAGRRYIANGSVLAEGVVQDMFGNSTPMPVWAPSFNGLMLFGENSVWGDGPDLDTGMYQFVFEVRDGTGTEVIARGNAMYSHVDAIVEITADITADTLWTNNNAYYLNKTGVYVGGDPTGTTTPATLTIEPGTFVLGSRAAEGMLAVTRGSKMIANGTSMLPIVFTSELTRGNRAAGDWGGLVLNGSAPINDPTGEAEGEGNSGPYGGDDEYDSSGVLNYVRVEFAGIRFSEQNELNGIAFQGVGAATQCSNIEVLNNQDDGVEFFGGTVNCENVFLYNNEDDSVDWTQGWTGYLRNVVVVQNKGGISDNGIEADSNEDAPDDPPVSRPRIYNATFIGSKDSENAESPEATQWRRGTGCIARNFIVMNFRDVGIRVDGEETCAGFGTDLVLTNSIYYDNGDTPFTGGCGDQEVQDWFETESALNRMVDPMLADPTNTVVPNVTPLPGSPALDATYAGNGGYIGGVDPNDPWIYEGWTTFIRN